MKSNNVRTLLHALTWLVFIGLLIQAGSILTSYIISLFNPEAANNLYRGLDLSDYYEFDFFQYSLIVAYKVTFYALMGYISFLLTKLFTQMNLEKPFTSTVFITLSQLNRMVVIIWFVSLIHNIHIKAINEYNGLITPFFSSSAIIFAAFIYLITDLFKRGIQLQKENDLTV